MARLLRWLSIVLVISALIEIVILLVFDALNGLEFTSIHRQTGALSFILIGSSFIGLQLGSKRSWITILKEIPLGIAFLFWGTEQLLPASPWVTAMDSVVVLIFVLDLSLIILERLKQEHRAAT
jgi:hypothetical protein